MRVRLVAFDLDGTLLRGATVCEVIARRLGQLPRMQEFERYTALDDIRAAREEMATWYAAGPEELCSYLVDCRLAPGAREGFHLLREQGITTAIVSVTWEFAVAWFARELGADFHAGTRLRADGRIAHFWPEDKPRWLARLARRLGVAPAEVAAVGDSWGDVPLLRAVGRPYFVGPVMPPELERAVHLPAGDLLEIARSLTAAAG